MTPSARLQAAIELLDRLDAGHLPADRLAAGYFRERRYAGSGDRRAVTEIVYAVLRRRAELAWRLGGRADGRALVLAHLAIAEGLDRAAIEALFDGGRYAPAPLDDDERRLLDRLAGPPPGPPPDWVRGNFPAWLEASLARRFGGRLPAEAAALNGRAPLDLRVNSLKATREAVLRRLAEDGIAAAPGRLSPLAVRLERGEPLTGHPLFRDGAVEVQDEGSQLVALLADARPGQRVLDLCAGAGGKTLAMAAAMRNQGRIQACDTDAARLRRMGPRLARAGVRNVEARPLAPGGNDPWLGRLAGRFDRVLIDAPCSGTGTWRRNPEAKWRLTPDELAGYLATQRALLDRGAALAAPGGRLVYATCSLLPEEGEDQAAAFLARHPDFAPLPVGTIWPEAVGGTPPPDGPYLVLSPGRDGTDGFFLAVLRAPAAGPGGENSL